MCVLQRLDNHNNNTALIQNASNMVYDAARGKVYVAYGECTTGGDSHNKRLMFVAIDAATKVPGTPVQVDSGTNYIEAINMRLLPDGTILIAYGTFGVRVAESTDGGATWPTIADADGTWGASTRALAGFISNDDASLLQLITWESGGGGSYRRVYMFTRTGVGGWSTETQIHAAGSQFFVFDSIIKESPNIGWITDANKAFIVADYSNASSQTDQVRCLYTTDAWSTPQHTLVQDYTGTSATRNPITRMNSGRARTMWVESGAPTIAYSDTDGASWVVLGEPTDPGALASWDATFDRWFNISADGKLWMGRFETTDLHHAWGGDDGLAGWEDTPCDTLAYIGDTDGCADAIFVDAELWRVFTRNNGGTYEVHLLTAEDVAVTEDPLAEPSEQLARGNVILATVYLPAFGANPERVLHLSNRPYVDPDDLRWDPFIRVSPTIDHGGGFMEFDWQPVDLVLEFLNGQLSGQVGDERFSDLWALYPFTAARVHVQQGFDDVEFLHTLFDGEMSEPDEIRPGQLTMHCIQDRGFSKTIPPRTANESDYPRAPRDIIGSRIPIVIGDYETLVRSIGSITQPYTYFAGNFRGGFPVLAVELESAAGAATNPKVLLSDRPMKSLPTGILYYEQALDVLCHSHTVASTSVGSFAEVLLSLADYEFAGAIIPIEIDTGVTNAGGAQELIRADKKRQLPGHAVFDWDGGKKVAQLLCPDLSELGTFVDMYAYFWFNKNASSAPNPQWGVKTVAHGDSLSDLGTGAVGTIASDVVTGSTVIHIGPGGANVVRSWAEIKDTKLFAEVRAAGQLMDAHRINLYVVFKPAARIVRPGTARSGPRRYSVAGRRVRQKNGPGEARYSAAPITSPDVTEYDHAFYAYGQGVKDGDHQSGAADGTYTGTANSMIEHPCDVAHWVLRELGDVPANQIVTGAGKYGSFVSARSALSGYKVALQIAEESDVEDFMATLGEQVLCWFMRQPTEPLNPWVAVPWDVGSPVNYRSALDIFTFTRKRGHIAQGSFRAGKTRLSLVRNDVRVNFDWDQRTNSFAEQLYISPDGSRVFNGTIYTTDTGRVADAAESEEIYKRREGVLNLPWVKDPSTASSILTRFFDLRVVPRAAVRFQSFVAQYDLNRGHVIQFSPDWDSFVKFPNPYSDGSWAGKAMRVTRVKRLRGSVVRYDVEAVEV